MNEPLWHDGWEQEADAKAGNHRRPSRRARKIPSDYGRSSARPEIPRRRSVDVIWSL
ncbi:hypothetical protein ACFU8I_02775 [Streptomyces sp. NPDC057540]|uniref:hypothetical protein n=1 Tax=Streptomyces sp. NPDC057540 TaxID=3346160 RepID=UPI00369B31E1